MKKPYVRALALHQPNALSHGKGGRDSDPDALQPSWLLCDFKRGGCANFCHTSHCWELYSDSTSNMACSLTLAKTSESPAKKGQSNSPPPFPPSSNEDYWEGQRTQESSETCPPLQIHKDRLTEPGGDVGVGGGLLNLNQVGLTWERKISLLKLRGGRGAYFSPIRGHFLERKYNCHS